MRGPGFVYHDGYFDHPEWHAPKQITCHAKSSYYGFTKGFIPANSRFLRDDVMEKNTRNSKRKEKKLLKNKKIPGEIYGKPNSKTDEIVYENRWHLQEKMDKVGKNLWTEM